MARDRKQGRASGTVKLSVDVDGEMHRRLSVLAALRGVTLRDVVTEALAPVASRVRMPSTVTTGAPFAGGADNGEAPAA